MAKRAFYRNRMRSGIVVAVTGAVLVAAVSLVVWSLLDSRALEELVERSWRQRLVVALPYALLVLPGAAVLVVVHGRRAADERPLLVLDDSGIFYRDWRAGRVPWADVIACRLIEIEEGGRSQRREWYLEVHVGNAEKYLRKVHGGGEFSESYKRRYFRIPLRNVKAESRELLQAVESCLRA